MCLSHPTELKVAEEDITCYKVLYHRVGSHSFVSIYQGFFYQLNMLYEGVKLFINRYDSISGEIHEGFHAYLQLDTAKEESRYWQGSPEAEISIVKCIIPKGSHYAVGSRKHNDNQIVGSAIRLIEVL